LALALALVIQFRTYLPVSAAALCSET
jgi:hypothetical protein